MILALSVVVFFSVLGFWKPNPLPFMLAAGASLMLGLYWFDVYTTNIGLGISLMMIAYSLVCIGWAFRLIFWKDRLQGEE